MIRLYEWCVATGPDHAARVSPVGLTDAEPRAQARMLEALAAVPPGIPARGWVVAMLYMPASCSYDRFETRLCAKRTESGELQLAADSHD
jgi:hypothetical protein